MSGPSFGAAARILAERDPVIARLVAEAGPPRLSRATESHFGTLVRAIVYQQRAVDGGNVPDLPAAPAGRLAGRRPRRPPRLRAGLAGSRADRAGAQAARRAVPPLPVEIGRAS